MEHEFTEFSYFGESDDLLKYELGSIERSRLLHVLLALW